MTEIWKKHPKWDIELSSMGGVRRNGKIKKISHKVSYSSNAELRYGVTSVGGKRAPILRVGRLVLETFVGPCPAGLECRHLDGNSLNDSKSNLAWGTRQEQIQDQKDHGTFSPPPVLKGKANPAWRHSEAKYRKALKLIKGGRSVRSVAILVGISKSQLLRRVRAVEVMP